MRRIFALTFATAAIGIAAGPAKAATCPTGTGYLNMAGSTAAQEIISGGVGALMADAGTTIVYWSKIGSCAGLDLIYSNTSATPSATIYNADGTQTTCGVDGGLPDMVASDVYPNTCEAAGGLPLTDGITGGGSIPPGYTEIHGPWQAMMFVQPISATAPAGITAEQAYWVLGFGPNGGDVSPWNQSNENQTTNPGNFLFIRSNSSGTQGMITAFVYQGYENYAGSWIGWNALGTGAVVSGVGGFTGTGTNSVLGIVALDAYGQNRALSTGATLQELPFRAYGQSMAWYTDSSATANDRKNVRDGHYQMTGPVHFVAATTDGTTPTNPEAKAFLDVLSGATQLPGTDIVTIAAQQFVVPDCAMQVTRAQDGPPLTTYTPPHLCGCAFEHDVGATPSQSIVPYACNTCGCPTGSNCTGAAGPCAAGQPICNYGYCEAQ
jgi:hypothetical protein